MTKPKRTVLVAALVAAAFVVGGVVFWTLRRPALPKAELRTNIDSLSYVLGMMYSIDAKAANRMLQEIGSSPSHRRDFLDGVWAGLEKGYREVRADKTDAASLAYNEGVLMGDQLQAGKLHRIELMLEMQRTEWQLSRRNFMAGLADYVNGTPVLQNAQGRPISQEEAADLQIIYLQRVAEQTLAPVFARQKKQNDDFMTQVAKRPGVKPLGGGVFYKELTAGSGAKPLPSQTVGVRYEGRFIDGKVFDATTMHRKPVDYFPLGRSLIKGWNIAVPQMPLGAKWELYVPWQQAYGALGSPPEIQPFSTLIFTIELAEIK